MQIFIKNFDGKTLTIDVELNTTVLELKEKISLLTGAPVNIMRIIFASKQLDNFRQLGDYNIMSESNLHVLFRLLSGGMVFVKFKKVILSIPVKLDGLNIITTPHNIIENIYNMNEFKYIFKNISNKSYCITQSRLKFIYKKSMKLDNYVSLHNYGIMATSIPNKKYLLKLKIGREIKNCERICKKCKFTNSDYI
jgi:hypothetical protein